MKQSVVDNFISAISPVLDDEGKLTSRVKINEWDIFAHLKMAAKELGFQYCSYGCQPPKIISSNNPVIFHNYEEGWENFYVRAGLVDFDPIVDHCRKSRVPIVWDNNTFSKVKRLGGSASDFGLRYGWSQSCLDANGFGGLITFARADKKISTSEAKELDMQLRWLANIAHLGFAAILRRKLSQSVEKLSQREIEVLKWSAEGKTSEEIAGVVGVSTHTVNFHLKNAIVKLNVPNKTAAVAKVTVMGLLY